MSTPTDPSARLTAAASRLRTLLADLGDNRGPWYVVNREERHYPQRIDNIGVPYVVASTTTDPSHPPTVADYICVMHPGVGLALAQLLETEARVDAEDRAALAAEDRDPEVEHRSCTVATCTTEAALALADAILGGGQ